MMNRAYSLLSIKRADEETRTITGMATTPAPDRLEDEVLSEGAQFSLPMPLLWQHDSAQPIGHVTHAKTSDAGIEIKAKIARIGESGRLKDRLDEAWQSIKTGLVSGLSIGFKPIEHEQIKGSDGIRYTKWDWLELSCVTIPANSEATITAIRSLDTAQRAASGQAKPRSVVRLNPPGASGPSQPKSVLEDKMKTIAEQISALEAKRAASAARMETIMQKGMDESRTTDATEQDEFDALAVEVEAIDKDLTRLRQLEKAKALTAKPIANVTTPQQGSAARGPLPAPYAVAEKKIAPKEYVLRAIVCKLKAHFTKQSPYDVVRQEYGDDEPTRAMLNIISKSATVPADTVTTGWAKELVQISIQDFFGALMPLSVYPGLASRGAKFTFGTAGVVSMPTRSSTPTIAGSFVAQGSPIPVRQGAFAAITFTPKKMGVISSFTREIAEHSTPNIEGLVQQAIIEDTAVAVDTVLLDANAATTTRPAGLKNGVAATTATAGGGMTALIGDIRGLTGALITGTNGNLRAPVWIMNPSDVLAASLVPAVAGGGQFPFKDELAAGRLQGYPVIQSATVAQDTMLFVDAADFVSVTGDTPRFDISEEATLHFEDTSPQPIGTVGSPNVVAAPTRSLWQTDTIGVRMLMDINWGLRRTGVVAWTQAMTWN